ncbi:type IV toxin-antitoxin system AbiEi family antitoxin [Fodinibius sp.]|uniref:type IV toxin-antitoxin system AbiEi family antitoxin n=1 Tax=Fodinibius sp. TaxID=1872440 RepID=UPI002ACD820F|nr:type IV toxin-antitoxin system AbiEi family antitoxin [Fodinibius sp.]MDZ7660487.1 type IV toxin-antitoxin system AbiEi family antitoxin [Fodinibius sp.]
MEEKEIIHTALEHLEPALLKGEWHPFNEKNKKLDGELILIYEHQRIHFDAIVKKEFRTYQIEQIIDQADRYQNPMVIAYRLFPALKDKLKEHRINYLEANGNLFVHTDHVLLFLDRDKKLHTPDTTGNRAFTPTGLKVLFELLRDKELIHHTQREIAKRTGVALGNIPKVLKGLQETGFLYKINKKKYALNNNEELLHKWVEEYKNVLQPTLEKGRFTLKPPNKDWRELKLHTPDTVWGGEPAGDVLTNYLRPETLTIYTSETKKNLMMHYGLMPDKEGPVQVYEKFWKQDEEQKTAPDILVYADLMNTQDKRCIETAEMIYNERIKPEL